MNEELSRLWKIIKDANCVNGKRNGLKQVEFRPSISRFEERYRLKSNSVKPTETIVVGSVQEMIELIQGKDVRAHHLTCASQVDALQDTALCVHYNEGEKRYSVALPGIGYIK